MRRTEHLGLHLGPFIEIKMFFKFSIDKTLIVERLAWRSQFCITGNCVSIFGLRMKKWSFEYIYVEPISSLKQFGIEKLSKPN